MGIMIWKRAVDVAPPTNNTAWPSDSEELPTAITTLYADVDAPSQGDGTRISPYNDLPGLGSASDARVNPGTRVIARGHLKDFGLLRRQGTLENPVVYVGNDPSWGILYAEAHDDLATVACATATAAMGNPNYTQIQRAVIAGTDEDWLRGIYDNKVPGTVARFPDLSDDDLYDYDQWYKLTYAEASWYAGQIDGLFNKGLSVGRISIMLLPEVERLKVLSARRAGVAPILMLRGSSNILKEFPAYFGDANGAPNPEGGLYLIGSAPHGLQPYAANSAHGRWAVANLPMAITRPGRYAQNAAEGWALHWPRGSIEQIQRANLRTGMTFGNHTWIIGWQFSGFTSSPALRNPSAVSGIRVRRCIFHGSTQLTKTSVLDLVAGISDSVVAHNSFFRTTRGAQLRVGAARNVRISCNLFDRCGDTALNVGSKSNAVNLLIEANYIANCNGGHGNQLTLYATPYNVVIRGNVSIKGARPHTMELGANEYSDVALVGVAPSLLVENNLFSVNGISTAAWGFMYQDGTAIRGLRVINNRIDGGPQAKAAFLGLGNSPETCEAVGNVLLGILSDGAIPCILPGQNTLHAGLGAEASVLRAAWANDNVDPFYCAAVGA